MEGKRPDYDEAQSNIVGRKEFDKFLGVNVELPGDDKESKVLARVRGKKRDHDGKLIETLNENPILNTQ